MSHNLKNKFKTTGWGLINLFKVSVKAKQSLVFCISIQKMIIIAAVTSMDKSLRCLLIVFVAFDVLEWASPQTGAGGIFPSSMMLTLTEADVTEDGAQVQLPSCRAGLTRSTVKIDPREKVRPEIECVIIFGTFI